MAKSLEHHRREMLEIARQHVALACARSLCAPHDDQWPAVIDRLVDWFQRLHIAVRGESADLWSVVSQPPQPAAERETTVEMLRPRPNPASQDATLSAAENRHRLRVMLRLVQGGRSATGA